MKKNYLFLVLISFLFCQAQGQEVVLKGDWKITKDEKEGRLQIKHSSGESDEWNFSSDIEELKLTGFKEGKGIEFFLRNDAGEIVHRGDVGTDFGSGTFVFTANRKFVAEIAEAGLTDMQATTLMFFTFQDVKSAYFKQLADMGYKKQLKEKGTALVALDISAEYIGKIRSLGFDDILLAQIISFKALGVTPEYVAEFRQQYGGDVSVSDLTSHKAMGIDPEYAAEMKNAGFDLSPSQLVSFKAMNIDAQYLARMKSVGIDIDDPQQLVMLKAQGVDAKFIEEYKSLGFTDMNPSSIVKYKIFKITPAYIDEIKNAGYKDISNEQLIEFKIHGIDAEFIKEAKFFNENKLPEPRQLIMMKISRKKPVN